MTVTKILRRLLTPVPGEPPYKDEHLVYAAYARCQCGSGMAHPLHYNHTGYWDCSKILKGEVQPILDDKGKAHWTEKHSDRIYFRDEYLVEEFDNDTTRPCSS